MKFNALFPMMFSFFIYFVHHIVFMIFINFIATYSSSNKLMTRDINKNKFSSYITIANHRYNRQKIKKTYKKPLMHHPTPCFLCAAKNGTCMERLYPFPIQYPGQQAFDQDQAVRKAATAFACLKCRRIFLLCCLNQ